MEQHVLLLVTRLIYTSMQASARISQRRLHRRRSRTLLGLGWCRSLSLTGTAERRSCSGGDIYIPRLSHGGIPGVTLGDPGDRWLNHPWNSQQGWGERSTHPVRGGGIKPSLEFSTAMGRLMYSPRKGWRELASPGILNRAGETSVLTP